MLRADRMPSGRASTEANAPRRDESANAAGRRGQGRAASDSWMNPDQGELAGIVRRICARCGWTEAGNAMGRTLAVASAMEREGKSSIASAIAIATAHDYPGDVLLLECDLLRPSLGDDFGVDGGLGLSEILADDGDLVDALAQGLRPTGLPNLWLLPAGNQQENPSRLLRTARMAGALEELRNRFAFIVLDLPAVLRSGDAPALARLTEGVVFVVRAGSTDQRAVQQAIQLLSGATLHGVVINRWRTTVPEIVRRIVEL